jgi:hypothetical protein
MFAVAAVTNDVLKSAATSHYWPEPTGKYLKDRERGRKRERERRKR